jgi:hypothetical protein
LKKKEELHEKRQEATQQNPSHNYATEHQSNKKEKMSRITITASNKKEVKPTKQKTDSSQKIQEAESTSHIKKDKSEKHFYESDSSDDHNEESCPQQKPGIFADDEHQAAIKIQKVYRGKKVRQDIKNTKPIARNDSRAEQLDSESDNKKFEEEEKKAALKIQANYRGHIARKKVSEIKQSNNVVQKKDSRPHKHEDYDEDEVRNDRIVEIEEDDSEKEKAAIKIQSHFKGSKQRKQFQSMKNKQLKQTKQCTEPEQVFGDEEHRAATKIQSRYKGVKQRKEFNNLKQQKLNKASGNKNGPEMQLGLSCNDEEHRAAVKIQSVYKGKKQRTKYQNSKRTKVPDTQTVHRPANPTYDQQEHEAATKIQKFYKAKKQNHSSKNENIRSEESKEKQCEQEEVQPVFGEEEHLAATKIQSVYKGKRERAQYNARKQAEIERIDKKIQEIDELDSQLFEKEKAAIKIQSTMRGKLERKKYEEIKKQKKNDPQHNQIQNNKPDAEDKNEEHRAATKIQSVYKGKRTREEFSKNKQNKNQHEKRSNHSESEMKVNDADKHAHESKPLADLQDQEKAATKIQSLYRGNRDRNNVQKSKNQKIVAKINSDADEQVQSRNDYMKEKIGKIETDDIKPKNQEGTSPMDAHDDDNDAHGHNLKKNYKGYLSKKKLEPRVDSSENIKSVSSNAEKLLEKKASVKKSSDVMPIYDARTESLKNNQTMTHRVSRSALALEKRKRASRTVNEFSELHKKTNEDGNVEESNSEKSFSIPDGKVHFYERPEDQEANNQAPRQRQSKINFREKIDEAKKNSSKRLDPADQPLVQEQKEDLDTKGKAMSHQNTEPAIHQVVNDRYDEFQEDSIKQSLKEPVETVLMKENKSNFFETHEAKPEENIDKSQQKLPMVEDPALFFKSKDLVRSVFKNGEKKYRNSHNKPRTDDVRLYGPLNFDPTVNDYVQLTDIPTHGAANNKYTSLAKDIDSRIVNSNRITESRANEQIGQSILPAGLENETDYELRTNESRSSIGHGGGELSVTVKRLTPSGVYVQGNMLRISLEDNDYKIQSLQSESYPSFHFNIEKQKFVLFEIVKAGDAFYSKTFPLEGLLFTERSVVVETLEFFIEQQSVFLDIEFEWIANVDNENQGEDYEPPNFQFDESQN